ncbi:HNH endonuclease [Candidatus Poriferisodalis sp.]|uniref:HNH endonuclease signature motif containing protein n=1 Tax=Candidatus Poriferisodalis sp. TaxID=3101277 RepID=UPI003B02CC83
MFTQVQQALECIDTALRGVDTTATDELREVLGVAKSLRTKVEVLETKVASTVARRERHGDGGAGLLNQISGLTRAESARNARVDAELAELPEARAAVIEGEVSLANAAKLAQSARKTSAEAVQDDADLLQMAKELPADEFAQAAQRWTIERQSAEDLAAQHRRNRRNRSVRFWNGEDGTVQLRGAFDSEMGARIQARLRREAELLRQADRRRQRQREPQHVPLAVRTRDQRMADALDNLVATANPVPFGPCDADGARSAATSAQATANPVPFEPCDGPDAVPHDAAPGRQGAASNDPPELHDAASDAAPSASADPRTAQMWETGSASSAERGECPEEGRPHESPAEPAQSNSLHPATRTEIVVRADLRSLLGQAGGIAEIAGSGPIPPNAVERLICNSDLSIVLCADQLTPLYEAVASRAPTAAQRRALIARDGSCVGCGAPPGECEAHHIFPWKSGGKTRIDNLVLVCWSCHDRIHDNNWRVVVRDGQYRLVPPDSEHPHNPAPSRKPQRRTPANGLAGAAAGTGRLDSSAASGTESRQRDRGGGDNAPALSFAGDDGGGDRFAAA